MLSISSTVIQRFAFSVLNNPPMSPRERRSGLMVSALDSRSFGDLGPVVRRPVNVNLRLKVNRDNNFPSIKMLSAAYVSCSLRFFKLKAEGNNVNRTPC